MSRVVWLIQDPHWPQGDDYGGGGRGCVSGY